MLYWLGYVPKGTLRATQTFTWLLFPVAYVVVRLARGAATGWYPYPCIHVGDLGYPRVALNITFLILAFATLSVVALGADKLIAKFRDRA